MWSLNWGIPAASATHGLRAAKGNLVPMNSFPHQALPLYLLLTVVRCESRLVCGAYRTVRSPSRVGVMSFLLIFILLVCLSLHPFFLKQNILITCGGGTCDSGWLVGGGFLSFHLYVVVLGLELRLSSLQDKHSPAEPAGQPHAFLPSLLVQPRYICWMLILNWILEIYQEINQWFCPHEACRLERAKTGLW